MGTTFLTYFEEVRFILELLLAVHLFGNVFVRRKDGYGKRVVISTVLMTAIALLYPVLVLNRATFSKIGVFTILLTVGWYSLMVLLTGVVLFFCYHATKSESAFLCAMGYALQHIEFALINEVIAKGIWKSVSHYPVLYIAICVVSTLILYYLVFRIFHKYFYNHGEMPFSDNIVNQVVMSLMLLLIIICTFMCQNIFTAGRLDYDSVNYLGATVDLILCFLVLTVGFTFCQINSLNKEKEVIEQLLYERKRQYELSKENIAVINSKCHDLKHQIKALEHVEAEERTAYIKELEEAIEIYDSVLNTGNEVVDTILSEKSLNCEKRNIRLSCICDAKHLDFMSTLDIYALLGNALDNAIENVSKYKNQNKRVISLSIKAVGDFLSIQTENYCEGTMEFEDGLPVTIKRNKAYHGYGMKSMRHIAKKYGGSLVCGVRNHSFTLQILLPMPAEFLRLYELREHKRCQL